MHVCSKHVTLDIAPSVSKQRALCTKLCITTFRLLSAFRPIKLNTQNQLLIGVGRVDVTMAALTKGENCTVISHSQVLTSRCLWNTKFYFGEKKKLYSFKCLMLSKPAITQYTRNEPLVCVISTRTNSRCVHFVRYNLNVSRCRHVCTF